MIMAAPAAAADAPAGRLRPGVRVVELGVPVSEQAGVLVVLVVAPEILERFEVVGLGLDRPGGRDLRAVETMARPHRGSGTARARGGRELAGPGAGHRAWVDPGAGTGAGLPGSRERAAVPQRIYPGAGGWREHADLSRRGAGQTRSLGGGILRERRTQLAGGPRPGAAHPPASQLVT